MTEVRLQEELVDLKATYEKVSTAKGATGQTLIRLEEVALPQGCTPATTPVLVVCDGQPRPQIYVKPGIKVPNGAEPRSTSRVQVEGEEWLQFSYNFSYDERHSLVQFIGAALRRFAKLE